VGLECSTATPSRTPPQQIHSVIKEKSVFDRARRWPSHPVFSHPGPHATRSCGHRPVAFGRLQHGAWSARRERPPVTQAVLSISARFERAASCRRSRGPLRAGPLDHGDDAKEAAIRRHERRPRGGRPAREFRAARSTSATRAPGTRDSSRGAALGAQRRHTQRRRGSSSTTWAPETADQDVERLMDVKAEGA